MHWPIAEDTCMFFVSSITKSYKKGGEDFRV